MKLGDWVRIYRRQDGKKIRADEKRRTSESCDEVALAIEIPEDGEVKCASYRVRWQREWERQRSERKSEEKRQAPRQAATS
jgi:hypothetical protein